MEVSKIIDDYKTDDTVTIDDVADYLESNSWFGVTPEIRNGELCVDSEAEAILRPHLEDFLINPHGFDALMERFTARFPETSMRLLRFMKRNQLEEDLVFYTADFLLYRLTKELHHYTDEEANELVQHAAKELEKGCGDCLTFFMAWLHKNRLTSYSRDFTMEKRYTLGDKNGAYNFDDYLQIFYYLFSEKSIEDNDMWYNAAESQNYTDTWLYLAVNCLCSLRQPDLERIYHPHLPCTPDEVLSKVMDGTFTDNEARETLLSVTQQLCVMPFAPNKTKRTSGVDFIKFDIPSSCEVMIGTLFALAEAHRQVNGTPLMPIIRKISTYRDIRRYMGDFIGDIFLEDDFRARSATKSYLQLIFTHADDVLTDEPGDGIMVRGYIAAALARSHKSSYGEYASSTFEYLKDAKLSGLTPEFIAFELLERGVLSFTASMLLNMVTNRQYETLTPEQQTDIVKKLALQPNDIENIISVVDAGIERSRTAVSEAVTSGKDLLTVLHRIGSGAAFSKQPQVLCLKTALGELCPFTENRNCVSCRYEISTKSTFYLMAQEYNRLFHLYKDSDDKIEKKKYSSLIEMAILPRLQETLECLRKQYGQKTYEDFSQLLKDNLCC